MKDQINILNEIAEILYYGTNKEYDTAHIEYKFNPEEAWSSFSWWYTKNNKNFSTDGYDLGNPRSEKLCRELHEIMYSHTGGDWRKFILKIDEKREVNTQFIYEIQSCMDEFKD